MTTWPEVNANVWLRLPCCGAEHPTRVEDHQNDDLVVAAPMQPHAFSVAPLAPEEGFFVGWIADGSAQEAPVTLVSHSEEPIPLWQLNAIGEPVETQRRNFVRLNIELEAMLYLSPGAAPVRATTVDLSEGGLHCEVDKWATNPEHHNLRVELALGDGHRFFLEAQVAWWAKLNDNGIRDVGIKFVDTPLTSADAIRGYIFAKQLETRRRGR